MNPFNVISFKSCSGLTNGGEKGWSDSSAAIARPCHARMPGVKMPREIGVFLSSMKNIGPSHSPEEQTLGLIAFGLVAITIVAVVKILVHSQQRDK